jgi:hypothetical protein
MAVPHAPMAHPVKHENVPDKKPGRFKLKVEWIKVIKAE